MNYSIFTQVWTISLFQVVLNLFALYCSLKLQENLAYFTQQIVGEMFAGDSFGELALLHDIKRAATIICKGDAEFLTVDKPDFDMVSICFGYSQCI